jgi:hypothetical protein
VTPPTTTTHFRFWQDPSDPDHPEFAMLGYKLYAGLVTAILCSLVLLINRFGLFAALS